jgi:hypothetical protein
MIWTAMSLAIWRTPWIYMHLDTFWFVVKRLDHFLHWAAGRAMSDAARAEHSSGEYSAYRLVFDTLQLWPCCNADCRTPASAICMHRSLTSDYPEVVSH